MWCAVSQVNTLQEADRNSTKTCIDIPYSQQKVFTAVHFIVSSKTKNGSLKQNPMDMIVHFHVGPEQTLIGCVDKLG